MDVLSGKIQREQDLKSWLEQLHENGKKEENVSNKMQGNKSSANFEFDSILGELDDLEKQFEIDNSQLQREQISCRAATFNKELSASDKPDIYLALEEFSLINSQLEDVLNDLAGFVDKPQQQVKSPTLTRIKQPPPPVPSKNPPKPSALTDSGMAIDERDDISLCSGVQHKEGNSLLPMRAHQMANRASQEANQQTVQACVNVHTPDGSTKCVYVTNETTVGDLSANLIRDHVVSSQTKFTLWEVVAELSMERQLDDDQLLLYSVIDYWSKNSNNKILMKTIKPLAAPANLKSDIEGTLHIKSEDKKSWKGYTFVIKPTGLFFYPKGKGKSEPSCYLDFVHNAELEVFSGVGWKKKYKAPTDFGFALKQLKVQTESAKDIKYFCTDSEALQAIWSLSIRQLLKKKKVQQPLPTQPSFVKCESLYEDNHSHYSEPYETQSCLQSRRISNASSQLSRSDAEESAASPSLKKFANLPITTETTRYLRSIQASIPQKSCPKLPVDDVNKKEQIVLEKNQRNQPCSNEYTASPISCKTPEILPKSSLPKGNVIKTLPKPAKVLCQQSVPLSLTSDVDLPPPPPSLMSQHSQYQTLPMPLKPRILPPPPPKRDQSTKLSAKPVDPVKTSIQTRNFILNLDRTIGQKKVFGAEGLHRVEMPLPPPPVVSEETSYIDLGELPPPPAELLQGLKCMKANPLLFHPHRKWP